MGFVGLPSFQTFVRRVNAVRCVFEEPQTLPAGLWGGGGDSGAKGEEPTESRSVVTQSPSLVESAVWILFSFFQCSCLVLLLLLLLFLVKV